jgi:glycosyltransferase involved in cell wall biosynthesis
MWIDTMKDNENVNIIIATHNDSKTIKRTLESVTNGIRPADQVVIGDNDSQDGTYEVLCDLLGAKPITREDQTGLPPQFDGKFNEIPVTIFRKKLSTIGDTLNIAMQMKWHGVTIFGFVDKASWYAPHKIPQAIEAFNSHKPIACVVSDCDNHYPDGRVERVFRCSFDMQRLLVTFPYDRNFLVRPQVFPKLKSGFNNKMPIRDDYDFLLRLSEIGLIYHIPAALHHNVVEKIDKETLQSITQCENMARQMASQRRSNSNG